MKPQNIALDQDQILTLLTRGYLGQETPKTAPIAMIHATSTEGLLTRDNIQGWTFSEEKKVQHTNAILRTFGAPILEHVNVGNIDQIPHQQTDTLNPIPKNMEYYLGAEAQLHHANKTLMTNESQEQLANKYPTFNNIMQSIYHHTAPEDQKGPHSISHSLRKAMAHVLTDEEKKIAAKIVNDVSPWEDALKMSPPSAALTLAYLRPKPNNNFHQHVHPALTNDILCMNAAFAGAATRFKSKTPQEQELPQPLSSMIKKYTILQQQSIQQENASPLLTAPINNKSIIVALAPTDATEKNIQSWSNRVWNTIQGHDHVRVIGTNPTIIAQCTQQLQQQRPNADVKSFTQQDYLQSPLEQRIKIKDYITKHGIGVDIDVPNIQQLLESYEHTNIKNKKEHSR